MSFNTNNPVSRVVLHLVDVLPMQIAFTMVDRHKTGYRRIIRGTDFWWCLGTLPIAVAIGVMLAS